jgi:hypothetical protein
LIFCFEFFCFPSALLTASLGELLKWTTDEVRLCIGQDVDMETRV